MYSWIIKDYYDSMEIKVDNGNRNKLFSIEKRWVKLLLTILAGVLFLCVVSVSSMYYGIKLYRSGAVGATNFKLHDLATTKLRFIPNFFRGRFSNPDEFVIDIKFKDLKELQYYRNLSLEMGEEVTDESKDHDISAKLTFQGKTYKVKMSLTGTTLRHIADPDKWSYRIKVKDGEAIMRMKEFNILYPTARGYLSDWIGHKLQERLGLIPLRTKFVDVTINGKDLGLYYMEENYDKILTERNRRREGLIFKLYDTPDFYNEGEIDSSLKERIVLVRNLVSEFKLNELKADQLFDLPKMAKFFALNDLLNGGHHGVSDMRFYFNPVTNLIEPIGREWEVTANKYKNRAKTLTIEVLQDAPFYNNFFYNPDFVKLYVKELQNLSQPSFLDQFFKDIKDEMRKMENIVYRDNPFYKYPTEVLYENQDYIRSKLTPIRSLVAYYHDKEDSIMSLTVRNLQCLPIEIQGIIIEGSATIYPLQQAIIDGYNEEYSIFERENKRSYSKFEIIDFKILPRLMNGMESENIVVNFKIIGLDSIYSTNIVPWPYEKIHSTSFNFPQSPANVHSFDFVDIDSLKRKITFRKEYIKITRDMIIPEGYEVYVDHGTRIDLVESSSIISYSSLRMYGLEESPILIYSSDSTGQGICVFHALESSYLNHVHCKNLLNPQKKGWDLTGALVFYDSDVTIEHCAFSNNLRGDDMLNIINSRFEISNTIFRDIYADAFDSDFSDGNVFNTSFINCGNDAIDISGAQLTLEDVYMDNIGDKGLSAGENSSVSASNLQILNSEISVCSKDMSTVTIDDIILKKNTIGFNAFKKKAEFGPGAIVASKVNMSEISVPYLIETLSNCVIDGKEVLTKFDNVGDKLYGNQYGKSSN